MAEQRIAVVGAGIVGLALARRLATRFPDSTVTVLDKEPGPARHQTGRNSGVVHAGIYYAPGSLKAQLCTRGRSLLLEYCQDRGLPYDQCGKLVVALTPDEQTRLAGIWERASANGVPRIRQVGAAEIREIEPQAVGLAGIHSPVTAISDYVAITKAFATDLAAAGGHLRFGFAVDRVQRDGDLVRLYSGAESLAFDHVVIAAGLQADKLAVTAGDGADPRIVPFRGEYFRLRPERSDLVRGLIYPVPDPRYPFLGVHFTRRIDGVVDIGPNAVLAFAREGYRFGTLELPDLLGTLSWPGFRRMARRHWRMGAREFAGSLSRRRFVALAQGYVPGLGVGDVLPAPAGVRAQAVARDGSLVDDFRISRLGPVTAIRNAPSPAATSSLAIAEHVVERLAADVTGAFRGR